MMTYEEALEKFAAKEFGVHEDDIETVHLGVEGYMGGYCDTCEYATARILLSAWGSFGYRDREFEAGQFSEVLTALIQISFDAGTTTH